MPTNANTFNSRVTSEALEAKFRQVFPSQNGAELPQDLFASGVITPVVDFSAVAEGDLLPQNLQTAWDFSTGSIQIASATPATIISNPGFWLVDLTLPVFTDGNGSIFNWRLNITDGATVKPIWAFSTSSDSQIARNGVMEGKFVVFLRSGDSLTGQSVSATWPIDVWYRQIADVNGNVVNPLGFTFS